MSTSTSSTTIENISVGTLPYEGYINIESLLLENEQLKTQIEDYQKEYELLISQGMEEYATSATSTELEATDYLFFISVFLAGIFIFLLYKEITKLVYVRR